MTNILLSTTPTFEGKPIAEYLGIVTSETIIGANVFKDFMASLSDFFGGRSNTYENTMREAKELAIKELAKEAEKIGADAVVGVDLDYETINNMLMVMASGTAVKFTK